MLKKVVNLSEVVLDKEKVRHLGRLINRVHNYLARIRTIELNRFGLTPTRVGVVTFIKETAEPATIPAIAARVARELNTVTELLKRMEKDGLIRKVRKRMGRKIFTVELTEKGEAAYLKATQINILYKVLSSLSQEERERCEFCLEKLKSISLEELCKLTDIPTT